MVLYIDPGTGSMLFTILIGIIGAGLYSLRMILMKIRFRLSGGKADVSETKIPFVIFSDHKRYWLVFEPICKEMSRRGKEVVYMTASDDDPALECELPLFKAEFIGEGNKAFAKLNFLNAGIVLSTTPGLDVYQWKRSKRVDCYVHLLHAASEVVLYKMFGLDYYDTVLLSGEYQKLGILKLEQLRNLPHKELIKVGIPYMDEMKKRLDLAGKTQNEKRVILLAPSWGKNAILSVYGSNIIELLLETGYQIIIRPHPQSFVSEKELMDELMKKYPESDQLKWNRDTDNFYVLNQADLLVSDFSGVIFDFALVYDKPVIYTNPDFDVSPYDAWWLDGPLWTMSALPRLGQELNEQNFHQLKELIDECLSNQRYDEGRRSVLNETWEYQYEGTQRTVDYLIAKLDEISAKGKR